MFENARRWGLLVGGFAAGTACVLGLAGPIASAEPTLPLPAVPAPATVTQTVTVQAGAPAAAAGPNQLIASPASPAAPVAPAVPAIVPATSGTLADFFK